MQRIDRAAVKKRIQEKHQREVAEMKERRRALNAHPKAELVYEIQRIVGKRLVGDYLEPVETPSLTLDKMVFLAERFAALLPVLHPSDIATPHWDAETTVKARVKLRLNDMVNTVVQANGGAASVVLGKRIKRPRPGPLKPGACETCNHNMRARDCPGRNCGTCCRGCARHKRRKV